MSVLTQAHGKFIKWGPGRRMPEIGVPCPYPILHQQLKVAEQAFPGLAKGTRSILRVLLLMLEDLWKAVRYWGMCLIQGFYKSFTRGNFHTKQEKLLTTHS